MTLVDNTLSKDINDTKDNTTLEEGQNEELAKDEAEG